MAVRLVLAVVLFPLVLSGQSAVIPRPAAEEMAAGRVPFNATWCIVCAEPGLARVAARTIGFWTGIKLDAGSLALPRSRTVVVDGRSNDPAVRALGPEGYRLEISSGVGARIESSDPAGAFYGLQTLVQVFQNNGSGDWELPVVRIEDAPRFAWRGMWLDCAGGILDKMAVRRLLNVMALYKMNTLHWRLADAAHWRVESVVLPGVTGAEVFYSQAEIRELVAYAAERHIRIVPEWEDARPAEEIFPEKSEKVESVAVKESRWRAFWEEAAALFPGEYVQVVRGTPELTPKVGAEEILRQRGKKLVAAQVSGGAAAVRLWPIPPGRGAEVRPTEPVVWLGGVAEAGRFLQEAGRSGTLLWGGVVRMEYGRAPDSEVGERAAFPVALGWADALWAPLSAEAAEEGWRSRWRRNSRFLGRLRVAWAREGAGGGGAEEGAAAALQN